MALINQRTSSLDLLEVALAVAASALGIFSLILAFDQSFWVKLLHMETNIVPIASLADVNGSLRFKRKQSPIWRFAEKEGLLFAQGDSIFTGADSTARIEMLEGTKIFVQPHTVLIIEENTKGQELSFSDSWLNRFLSSDSKPRKKSVIKVQEGTIQVDAAPKSKIGISAEESVLTVESKDTSNPGRITIRPSEVILENESELEVKTEKGTVFELKKGEAVEINDTGKVNLKKITFKTLYPSDRAQIVAQKSTVDQNFRWKLSREDFRLAKVDFFLKKEPESFKRISLEENDLSTVHTIEPGSYQWRIELEFEDGTKLKSPTRSLTVKSIPTPILEGPQNGAEIEIKDKEEDRVLFDWRPSKSIADYPGLKFEIQIQKNDETPQKFIASPKGFRKTLEVGNYTWSVRSFVKNQTSSWTKPRKLSLFTSEPIVAEPEPEPEQQPEEEVKNPPIEITNISGKITNQIKADGEKGKIFFTGKWDPVENGKDYKVSLYGPNGKLLKSKTVTDSQIRLVLPNQNNNKIYFDITATADDGRSAQSKKMTVTFQLVPPRPKIPLDQANLGAKQRVILTWETTSLTNEYEIEIAKDAKFVEVVKREKSTENYLIYYAPSPGTHYWRVRGLTGTRGKSRWSAARSFLTD